MIKQRIVMAVYILPEVRRTRYFSRLCSELIIVPFLNSKTYEDLKQESKLHISLIYLLILNNGLKPSIFPSF